MIGSGSRVQQEQLVAGGVVGRGKKSAWINGKVRTGAGWIMVVEDKSTWLACWRMAGGKGYGNEHLSLRR